MSEYDGPKEIGWASMPGRGTTYDGKFGGHDVQVYITEKRKAIRVFVDNKEWKENK